MKMLDRQVSLLGGRFDRALARYLSCGGGNVARRSFRGMVGAFRKLAIVVAEADDGQDYLGEVEARGRALIGALLWTATRTGERDDSIYTALLADVEKLGVRTRITIDDPALGGKLVMDLAAGEIRLEPPTAPQARWAVIREDSAGQTFFMTEATSKNEAAATAARFRSRVPGASFVVEPVKDSGPG